MKHRLFCHRKKIQVVFFFFFLEVGHGSELVPLDRLFAQVKVFEAQRDATQEVVLAEGLGTQHAELQLAQAQCLLAVAAVHQLRSKVSHMASILNYICD